MMMARWQSRASEISATKMDKRTAVGIAARSDHTAEQEHDAVSLDGVRQHAIDGADRAFKDRSACNKRGPGRRIEAASALQFAFAGKDVGDRCRVVRQIAEGEVARIKIVDSADVRLSTQTSMVGGSAQTWVAERPSKPAGLSAKRAATMVLPVARWPTACQNCFASTARAVACSDIVSAPGPPTDGGMRDSARPMPALPPRPRRGRSNGRACFVASSAVTYHGSAR